MSQFALRRTLRVALATQAILVFAVLPSRAAPAPKTIPFQGSLTRPSGQTGPVTLTLSLYSAASGGTALWSEQQSVTPSSRGLFNIVLGSVTPFPSSLDFSQAYFVGVAVGSDAEMTPRLPLAAVPYALFTYNVANDASLLAKVSGGAVTTDGTDVTMAKAGTLLFSDNGQISSHDDDHRIVFNRAGNILDLREYGDIILSAGSTSGTETDKLVVKSSGNVGIGTVLPQAKLDVKGNAFIDPTNFGGVPTVSLAVGDTDTGLNSAGDGQLDIYSNNTKTMSIRSGAVGIGTSSPSSTLTVAGVVESTSGGIKYPDGTVQTTAGLADNSVTSAKLAADTASLTKVSGGTLSSTFSATTDQVQGTGGLATGFGQQPQDFIQTFTPSGSGTLTGLDIVVDYRNSTPVTLSVGVPGGAVLTSQAITPGSGLTVKHFDLAAPVQLTGGQQYYWEIKNPGINLSMALSSTDVYSGGSDNLGNNTDFVFATYMGGIILNVTGHVNLDNGTIQRGGNVITGTNDLGLYSLNSGQFVRMVTNNAPIHFYTDLGSSNIGGSDAVVINTSGTNPRLDVSGRVRSAGFDTNSDARFKTNIAGITDGLGTIENLRGVTFDWKRDGDWANRFPEGRQVGFIAQEVEKVLPELVSTDADGYKAVAYQNIVPVLVEGMKEQQHQLVSLQADNDGKAAQIAALQKQNAAMDARLKRLESLAARNR